MILVIDNYDSFTYNLVDLILCNQQSVQVYKNDELTLDMIEAMKPSGILISPGPGAPSDAGICLEVVKTFYKSIPILGICLGHQIIAEAFGGSILQAKNLLHGKSDSMIHDSMGIFKEIPQAFTATRYHSLIVDEDFLPKILKITARSEYDQTIMAIRHIHYPVRGLQFHPESYLTSHGSLIIKNFIEQEITGGIYV
jgi:anthranilate synthase/aminodeoxychorismate synthase-like glutamine amidotransferase